MRRLGRRDRGARPASSRRSRRATRASRSPTPAARSGWSVECFRYYAGAPERLLGKTIPVAGGVDMTFREPLGVVGLIVAMELPARDRLVEGRAGARGRQHGRAEARRADPAHGARARADRPRGRAARRACSTSSPGPGRCAGRGWSSTPTSPRSRSPDRPRSGAASRPGRRRTIKRVTLELGREVGERRVRGRRPRGGGRRRADGGLRQRRPGLLRALADPRRALGAGRLPRRA